MSDRQFNTQYLLLCQLMLKNTIRKKQHAGTLYIACLFKEKNTSQVTRELFLLSQNQIQMQMDKNF